MERELEEVFSDSSAREEVEDEGEGSEKKELLTTSRHCIDSKKNLQSASWCNWKLVNTIAIGAVMWTAYFLCYAAISTIGPFFPKVGESKGTSPTMIGIIVGISPLTVVIVSPLFGYLLPRVGLMLPTFVGLAMTGTAYISLGFVNLLSSTWVFFIVSLLLRIIEGIGTAFFFTTTFAIFPLLFPDHVGTLVGLFELASGLGLSVGYAGGGALYKVGGFKLPFISLGGSVLLVSLPCTLLVRQIKKAKVESESLSLKVTLSLFSDLVVIALILALVASCMTYAFFTPILQPFLVDNFNYNSVEVGAVFICATAIYTVFSFIVGPALDKFGRHRYFILFGLLFGGSSTIAMGILYVLGIMIQYIIIIYYVLIGITIAFGIVPVYGDILKVASKNMKKEDSLEPLASFVAGLIISGINIGEFIGTLLGGLLTTFLSFQLSAIILGEILLAEMLLLWGVTVIRGVTKQQPHQTPTQPEKTKSLRN